MDKYDLATIIALILKTELEIEFGKPKNIINLKDLNIEQIVTNNSVTIKIHISETEEHEEINKSVSFGFNEYLNKDDIIDTDEFTRKVFNEYKMILMLDSEILRNKEVY